MEAALQQALFTASRSNTMTNTKDELEQALLRSVGFLRQYINEEIVRRNPDGSYDTIDNETIVKFLLMGVEPLQAYIAANYLPKEDVSSSCSCNYTEACKTSCTCQTPHMSGGCDRCCSYGSLEQRQKQADRLAQLTKENE